MEQTDCVKKEQGNYVEEAMRTDCEYSEALKTRCLSVVRLIHAALGISTEAGEFADAIKKYVFSNKPLDRVNLIEEIGDLFWYFAVVADELNFSFIDIMNANIAKLKLRYPGKFTEEDSANRSITDERKLLEKEIKIDPINIGVKLDKCIISNTPLCPEEGNWVKNTFMGKTNIFVDEDCAFNRKEHSPLTALSEVKRSKRAEEWIGFSNEVLAHIENYTVPQYGDYPNDQMTEWTVPECFKAVTKRVARYGRNSREGQQNLDFKKMAHEVCIAWGKYNNMIANADRKDS